jgi:uncharacterized protein
VTQPPAPTTVPPFDPATATRPAPVLMRYYTIVSLFSLVAFPVVFLVHLFKYETLRYRFEDEGVFMAWGVLFRREINLTYRRIQDIHLTRNIIQRWMGLATVSVQTASGSSTPEMSIEGILDYEGLRDFLYARMRGAKGEGHADAAVTAPAGAAPAAAPHDEALDLLLAIRDDLAATRAALQSRGPRP